MKPLYFPEANTELTKPKSLTEEQCGSLYVRRTNDGVCISLWTVSFWKRVLFLFHGKIWLQVWSGETQPPVSLECKQTIFKNGKDIKYKLSVPQPNRKRRRELIKLNGKKLRNG